MPEAPVLITGGTGFLGAGIVRAFIERRAEVHVLARASSDRSVLDGLGVTWHTGDLTDADDVERAVAAVAASAAQRDLTARLIHSGALISYKTADGERQREVNVGGTRHVLDAARRHAIGRVVHVSSVVTVGVADVRPLDETAPFNAGHLGVDYVNTKHAAEELALEYAREHDLVVVNPGAIFGRVHRVSNSARFLAEVLAGKGPPLAPPGGVGFVGLDDTVDGVLRALERGKRGERYILVESNITLLELFRKIAQIGGVRAARATLPRFLWPVIVAGARVVDRVRPLQHAPPQGLVLLGRLVWCDAGKARRELGWSPRPFDDVLADTIEHVRSRGAAAGT